MRKIALDADPGVADALALAFALFDPDVEIVAVTSVGGSVDPQTSARNLQSLVAFLDPPRLPRVGVEDETNFNAITPKRDDFTKIKSRQNAAEKPFFSDINATDALIDFNNCDNLDNFNNFNDAEGRKSCNASNNPVTPNNCNNCSDYSDRQNINVFNRLNDFNNFGLFNGFSLPRVERLSRRPAATILRDAVRSHPRETSILALGPLTNVARAFRRDPELPFLLNRLVVAGGGAPFPPRNNATEFNICCDPKAARVVFEAPCAKTFVPVDAVDDLVFSFDDLRSLGSRGDVVGEFLCRSLLEILRVRRRTIGSEVVYLQEFAAYFALVEPSLFSTVEAISLDEICGNAPADSPTDALPLLAERRPDLEIVRQIDVDAVRQKIVDGFQRIAPRSPSRSPR